MIAGRLKRPGPHCNDWVMQTNRSCRNLICNTGERIAGDETRRATYTIKRFEATARIAADKFTAMPPHRERPRLAFYSRPNQYLRKEQTDLGIRDGKADNLRAQPVVVG